MSLHRGPGAEQCIQCSEYRGLGEVQAASSSSRTVKSATPNVKKKLTKQNSDGGGERPPNNMAEHGERLAIQSKRLTTKGEMERQRGTIAEPHLEPARPPPPPSGDGFWDRMHRMTQKQSSDLHGAINLVKYKVERMNNSLTKVIASETEAHQR